MEIALSKVCKAGDLVTKVTEEDEAIRGAIAAEPKNIALKTRGGGKLRFRNHTPLSHAFRVFGDQVMGYKIITCERNPYDKLISGFFWDNPKEGLGDRAMWLDQFRTYLCRSPDVMQDSYALYSLNGFNVADHVIRYEHLERDVKAVANDLGLPAISLGERTKANTRPDETRETYADFFPADVDALVKAKYARQFASLGYPKPGSPCAPFKPAAGRQAVKQAFCDQLPS